VTVTKINIQGIDVFIDGDSLAPTVVMVHGWPDTHRLWDSTVQALHDQYRCVCFTLPGFDLALGARATSVKEMSDVFAAIVDAVSPDAPVTLLLHDWGCIFGYEYAAQHASRVQRIIGVDIGDHNTSAFHRSLNGKAKRMIMGYQVWLAIAWQIGSRLDGTIGSAVGNWMTRWMARTIGCRTASATIGWQMNYPYAMQWFGLKGGFRGAARVKLQCPTLFIYGEKKPFMFHSPQWLAQLAQQPGCAAQGLPTGHWVMMQKSAEFNACVMRWLKDGQPAAS
jgi:cis-3-alkyl-4-acyloxetan-2-one decarboxylase